MRCGSDCAGGIPRRGVLTVPIISRDREIARSCRMGVAEPPALDESAVILRSVDADARLVDQADGDGVAGFEHAELLELLGGLQRRRRKRAETKQELSAVGVETEVQIGNWRLGRAGFGKAVAMA